MKKINLEILQEKTFASSIAEEIVTVLNYAIEEKGFATLSLAGGQTPSGIYRRLSRPPYDKQIDWSKVYFIWGDERYVPLDDVNSNYRMVNETLLNNINVDKVKILSVNTTLSSYTEAAKNYSEILKNKLEGNLDFDLVLLGMGSDGHTASIFPNDPLIDDYDPNSFNPEKEDLALGVINPNDSTERITLTPNLIFNAKLVFFIVTGAAKSKMLNEVVSGSKSEKEIPSKLSFKANANVTWFVDSFAGKDQR